jgi:hypothetical protein
VTPASPGAGRDVVAEAEAIVRREGDRLKHRPDGDIGGPGAMCVECTPGFGTAAERPVRWPCAPLLRLGGPDSS